jgi:hypothetical protein
MEGKKIKRLGMAVWAKEKPPLRHDPPTVFRTPAELLNGLREEYLPENLPCEEMFSKGVLLYPMWKTEKGVHYTLRGWIAALRGVRAARTTCDSTSDRLEQAFLKLYPPFGDFTPHTKIVSTWIPGKVRASSRHPEVEYSLTSVFDTKILRGPGGWEAFHRLLNMAIRLELEEWTQKASLKSAWALRDDELYVPKKSWKEYFSAPATTITDLTGG